MKKIKFSKEEEKFLLKLFKAAKRKYPGSGSAVCGWHDTFGGSLSAAVLGKFRNEEIYTGLAAILDQPLSYRLDEFFFSKENFRMLNALFKKTGGGE